MKKAIAAIVAVFIGAFAANAQIGIMAGLTSSSSDIETAIAEVGNINQYHVGVTYKIGIGNLIAVQPALLYNVKGAALNDVAGVDDINFKTGFIELPVQVQLGFGIGSLARVYGFAEPFIGYAVSNSIDYGSIAEPESTWDNVKSRLEYGVSLGAGVEVLRHLQVSVKYFWNLGDVYGTDGSSNVSTSFGDYLDVFSGKSNGVALSVAFLF